MRNATDSKSAQREIIEQQIQNLDAAIKDLQKVLDEMDPDIKNDAILVVFDIEVIPGGRIRVVERKKKEPAA
jgi:hypothetical protein